MFSRVVLPKSKRASTARRFVAWVPFVLVAILALGLACTTSPLGRRQLKLMSEDDMDRMGVAAFAQISDQTPASEDASTNRTVSCVASAVTGALEAGTTTTTWEVRVFADPSPNAFALPGGKIGVNSGLLDVAETPAQLAAVLGHEVAHVIAGHSNERVSNEYVTQGALAMAAAAADRSNPKHAQVMGLLGVGAQLGILLPYSRTHEAEADLIGLDLMARAGFDPRQSVALWQNMAAAGGGQPPEFLSTHPSPATRIDGLEERMPDAMILYEKARSAGVRPNCS